MDDTEATTETMAEETGETAAAEDALTVEQIAAMTCKDLRKVLADLGEPDKGKKAELVERLCRRNGLEPLAKAEREATYAFPTKSRCPRCGVTDTVATTTRGDTQYRTCRRAICRHEYAVRGERI